MKRLYVIGGCNGAGKTTASYTILPDILDCREFINADEIARGISPFQAEKANIEAGKWMLKRINNLINSKESFAFETTLSSKNFARFLTKAKDLGYQVTCVFIWLESEELAIKRVKGRVEEGGHDIPEATIRRRYHRGLKNFFEIYKPIVDGWFFIDNSRGNFSVVAKGVNGETTVLEKEIWEQIRTTHHGR